MCLMLAMPDCMYARTDPFMERYIRNHRDLAEAKSAQYSIPVEVILGVAIVESGSGMSRVARELNNHFGMTGKNRASWKTRYGQYRTASDSYDHFCRFISNQAFYPKLRNGADQSVWIRSISRIGYSEKPLVWEKQLLRIINDIEAI